MRFRAFALTLPLAFTAAALMAQEKHDMSDHSGHAMSDAGPITYPETRREDVVEEQFGVKVADPYRWLEGDVREKPEVADWVKRENDVTNTYLATLPGRDIFKSRLKELYNYERIGMPMKRGGKYFYYRNSGLQNQSVLYVRDTLDGEGRVVIDPNTWSKDGATALAEMSISEDGKRIVYSIQDGGTDWRTVKVLDVATGTVLSDTVEWVKFSGLSWDKAGEGFFYSRFDKPADGEKFQTTNENQKLYYHRVGTPQSEDRLVHATPNDPKLGHGAGVTDDGRWLVIYTSRGTDPSNMLSVVDLTSADWKVQPLVTEVKDQWSVIGNKGTKFWLSTNNGAPRDRIVTVDVAEAGWNPVTVVPEDAATMQGVSLKGDTLIVNYLVDAKTEVRLFDLNGKPKGKVALPGIGSAGGFGGDQDDLDTFYSFSSYTVPGRIYRYDVATNTSTLWMTPEVKFNPDDYETTQVFYTSKDGTKVPMFITRKKGMTGPAPTLLYGYGGFNSSQVPGFSVTRLAWMEQGGVLAVANLRGGGEYGKAWHDAGRLQNKQNVFDDFIAAGEFLKAQGYTGKDQLAIQGGSNGGLLVGAVVNQRPDLFAAALPAVGVMDMLRFDRWTAGRYWVDDYGYPNKEADFKALLAYSPYHNVGKVKGDYPAILVTTADTDDRVVPGHSFKYAAQIQAMNLGPKPRLIRIETRAGHGSGKPVDKVIEEYADMWSFIAKFTGLTVKPVGGDGK